MAEAAAVSVNGWDFSWLDGRVLEERPPWGFQGVMAERMAGAKASLDLQTGGGEVLAGAAVVPPLAVAT
ncbi:MAG: SAM-dependent methyltransferase, partial [Specibacter sp.]